jgi:DNA-binding NtrC family response regulator
MVARRQFREDLFYRLHVVNIEVPPLRTRIDDLPLLTGHFLQQAGQRTGRPVKRLHPDLLRSFYERRWPGNIRELENDIERLVVLSGDAEVIPPELGQHGRAAPQEGSIGRFAALVEQGLGSDLATAVCQLEKDLIALGLRETRGNKSRLAARLGVSRTTLIKKIREYGLDQTDPGRTNPGIEE